MTPLDKTLKRSLSISGVDYVVTLTPEALKLTRKGRRLGMELKWADIVSGDSALAVALRASLGQFDPGTQALAKKTAAVPRAAAARRLPKKRPR
jgi:hypothetical protein